MPWLKNFLILFFSHFEWDKIKKKKKKKEKTSWCFFFVFLFSFFCKNNTLIACRRLYADFTHLSLKKSLSQSGEKGQQVNTRFYLVLSIVSLFTAFMNLFAHIFLALFIVCCCLDLTSDENTASLLIHY